MSLDVEIDGLRELIDALNRGITDVIPAIVGAVAIELQAELAPYPPSPPPRGRTFYERGFGTRYRRKDGSLGGSKTSEQLGQRWAIVPPPPAAPVTLKNTASYSSFVYGDDGGRQARAHAGRWPSWMEGRDAVEASGVAERAAEQALRKVLGL